MSSFLNKMHVYNVNFKNYLYMCESAQAGNYIIILNLRKTIDFSDSDYMHIG